MPRVKPKGRVVRPIKPPPRAAIESFDSIEHITEEGRELIAQHYPDLLAKLPPRKPAARSKRTRT